MCEISEKDEKKMILRLTMLLLFDNIGSLYILKNILRTVRNKEKNTFVRNAAGLY